MPAGPAVNSMLEGIVSTLTNNQISTSYPQSMTFWLRAMKECINFNARFVEDDHVIGVSVTLDGTTGSSSTIKADATWVYGFFALSTDTTENVAILANSATFNPGTTALDYMGVVLTPIAAGTTPAASGLVWFPYFYADVAIEAFGLARSDYDTTCSTTATNFMNAWVVYRNQ